MEDPNGHIPSDPGRPPTYGHMKTEDFVIEGDLSKAYQALKEMFDPPKVSTSGPIKPLTKEELDRERQQPLQDKADSIPLTITSL